MYIGSILRKGNIVLKHAQILLLFVFVAYVTEFFILNSFGEIFGGGLFLMMPILLFLIFYVLKECKMKVSPSLSGFFQISDTIYFIHPLVIMCFIRFCSSNEVLKYIEMVVLTILCSYLIKPIIAFLFVKFCDFNDCLIKRISRLTFQ